MLKRLIQIAFSVVFLALLQTGCESTSKKRSNAVMGEIPPRIKAPHHPSRPDSYVKTRPSATREAAEPAAMGGFKPASPAETIRQVKGEETDLPFDTTADDEIASDHQVVATVNGAPIFAFEILERYGVQLEQAQRQLPPKEYDKLRNSLLKRDLHPRIERKLLVQALMQMLKPEQATSINGQLDKIFETEISRLKGDFKVNSRVELEQELQKQGTSLSSLRDDFANQRMAMEYLGAKVQSNRKISRQDLLQYYRDHAADYATPQRVRWQQIRLSFDKNRGKQGARDVLATVTAELKNGTDFAELARKHSDGSTAREGGRWNWTQAGSLADEKLEKLLFELPVGEVGQLEGKDAFQLVRVTSHEPAGRTAFEEVQNEIQEKIEQQARKDATQKVLDDLLEGAVIETIFDGEKTPGNTRK